MRSTMAHVEPLPLVPATWMMLSLGSSASRPRRWREGRGREKGGRCSGRQAAGGGGGGSGGSEACLLAAGDPTGHVRLMYMHQAVAEGCREALGARPARLAPYLEVGGHHLKGMCPHSAVLALLARD